VKIVLSGINGSVGFSVSIAVLCGITNLSTYFVDIFDTSNWYFRCVVISNYTVFLVSFCLAADANAKVQYKI